MNKKDLVSIIIPIYNVEKFLAKCIESCLKQKYNNIEIILVDDGSPDNSGRLCDEFANKDQRIKVIHKSNEGVSAARNDGLKIAKGEWVIFIDADDYISDEFVEYMLGIVKKTNTLFGFSTECYIANNEMQNNDEIIVVSSEEATALLLSQKVLVGCWNKIYNRDFLNKNKIKFSTQLFYGEGLEFILNVAQQSEKIAVGKRKEYFYRKNNESSATTKFNIKKYYNGEKSLFLIRKKYVKKSVLINKQWKIHYTMFCLNSITDIIIARKKKEYYDDYLRWIKIIKENKKELLTYDDVSNKDKLKIFLACHCPYALKLLRNARRKQLHKNSV